MSQKKNRGKTRFSGVQKLIIFALIFIAVGIFGFLFMLLTGRMIIPL